MPAIFALLMRSRRLILISSIAALALAAIFAFALPPMYTSFAALLPPGSSGSTSAAVLMLPLSISKIGGLQESKSLGSLYMGVLTSQSVRRDVVSRLRLMQVYNVKKESAAEKKLASRSSIDIGLKAPIITISVMDTSPQRARDLTAAYLSALQQTSTGIALSESSRRRQFYQQRLDQEKAESALAEAALKQTEQSTGFVAPAAQVNLNLQAQARLEAQIAGLEAQVAALLQGETDQNPDVIRLRDEIGSLRAKDAQLENGGNGRFGSPSVAQVPGLQLEYVRKLRDVKYHEALLVIIAKQFEAAGLDQARESPLQVLDPPAIPDTRSGPKRWLIMALGLLLGLLASSSWVMFQAARSHSPLTPEL